MKPGEDVGGVLVGREDRVEDLGDPVLLGDQGQSFVQPLALELEGRQGERGREFKGRQ